ncbi:hypothetical protein [Luteolibacter soli]|uniref:Uncharacterized protein n=1 Tax=Luteolibacter soli TaxID=3135280 RepID=A0ABU9ARS5_9BACT
MSDPTSFWPSFEQFTPTRSPSAILREIANDLHKRTGNLVGAAVVRTDAAQERFGYNLNIKAPALGSYTFWLLNIEHPLEMYPLEISVDEKVGVELGFGMEGWRHFKEVENEEGFLKALGLILGTVRVRQVVGALITQARDMKAPVSFNDDSDDIPF